MKTEEDTIGVSRRLSSSYAWTLITSATPSQTQGTIRTRKKVPPSLRCHILFVACVLLLEHDTSLNSQSAVAPGYGIDTTLPLQLSFSSLALYISGFYSKAYFYLSYRPLLHVDNLARVQKVNHTTIGQYHRVTRLSSLC